MYSCFVEIRKVLITEKMVIMKITVVSYSMTGNNKALAASIASELSAEHINVSELKKMTNGQVALDMIFNRTPKVSPSPNSLDVIDFIIFVAPFISTNYCSNSIIN